MYYALVLFKYSSVKHLPVKFRTVQFSSSKFQSNIPDFLLLPEQGISHCSQLVSDFAFLDPARSPCSLRLDPAT